MITSKDERFYVFYDRYDRVTCCGTAKQLVESGYYSSVNVVHSMACRIQKGQKRGAVVILKGDGSDEE